MTLCIGASPKDNDWCRWPLRSVLFCKVRFYPLNDYFFTSKQWKTRVFNLCINSVTIWTFGGLLQLPDLTLAFTNNFVVRFFPTYFCPWFSLTNSRISINNPWEKLLKHLNIKSIKSKKLKTFLQMWLRSNALWFCAVAFLSIMCFVNLLNINQNGKKNSLVHQFLCLTASFLWSDHKNLCI